MSVEYARKGLMAVLTPQANTTVEPEMHLMTPPGFAWINARLMSDKDTIEARLLDYFDNYEGALAQFANAPVSTAGFASTGVSYLAGIEREDDVLARVSASRGYPVHTAASAVVDGLNALKARRIALISPYDGPLTDKATAYWIARGFDVRLVASAWRDSDEFHPIYSLGSAAARDALAWLGRAAEGEDEIDAVVMLGTGMPTLLPILERPFLGRAPVLSCMLCIAWRMVQSAAGAPADAESLLHWVRATHWGDATRQHMG